MSKDQIRFRLEEGMPFRLGELAKLLGYSREQLRTWANRGRLQTTRLPMRGAHRRVTVEEAERLARSLGVL